jgi:hypothetical protein
MNGASRSEHLPIINSLGTRQTPPSSGARPCNFWPTIWSELHGFWVCAKPMETRRKLRRRRTSETRGGNDPAGQRYEFKHLFNSFPLHFFIYSFPTRFLLIISLLIGSTALFIFLVTQEFSFFIAWISMNITFFSSGMCIYVCYALCWTDLTYICQSLMDEDLFFCSLVFV